MKNLLLGLCLVGLTFACQSNDTMSVDDAGNANMAAAECGGGGCEEMTECAGDKTECSGEMKAECSSMKAECSGDAADCSGAAAADCAGDKPCCADNKPADAVCPVTGKPIN